jgi:signal transduction histidine kinase
MELRETHSSRFDSLLDDRTDEAPRSQKDSLLIALALAMVLAITWVAFAERSAFERRQALAVALERDSILAVALEKYTVRVLKTAQAVTQYVAREYARGARGEVLRELLDDRMANNDIFSGLTMIGANGHVLASSGRPLGGQHILRTLATGTRGEIRIAGAGIGSSAQQDLSIARAIVDDKGQTDAVAVALVAGHRFLGVLENAKLGHDTVVLLADANGEIRASWNVAPHSPLAKKGTVDFESLVQRATAAEPASSKLDGVPRLVGLRKLEGHPLVMIVATSEADALSDFYSRRRAYFWASMAMSAFAILVAVALIHLSLRREQLAQRLVKAKARLRNSNADLENRIARRTSELALANQDLQLFTSALAHDVRAPLAAIAGFSQQLEPAIAATGDERLKHRLSRIRVNAKHMSDLTESILQLARLSARALNPGRVDVSAMAELVVNGLRERDPAREVEVDIAGDIVVYADPIMLREVLENLLGNAWKFTARRADARIKLAASEAHGADGLRTFIVSDNGAGFDMAYSADLFQPFRRLHAQTEFAGTGVGLAMVHRIISLHGGHAWAEGAPDRGATIYVSLPSAPAPGPLKTWDPSQQGQPGMQVAAAGTTGSVRMPPCSASPPTAPGRSSTAQPFAASNAAPPPTFHPTP